MESMKYLLVGQEPYDNNGDYGPTEMECGEYPFDIAAFIPTFKNLKNPKVITYIRVINLLRGQKESWSSLKCETLYNDAGKKLVKEYAKKGVYFCNKNDLEKEYFTSESTKVKKYWEINADTIILLFGSEAIKKAGEYADRENVFKIPHPSKNNTNSFWKEYDNDTNFTDHSSPKDIKKIVKNLSLTIE